MAKPDNQQKENVEPGKTDHALGMDRPIPRRDFLNGASVAIGASLVATRNCVVKRIWCG